MKRILTVSSVLLALAVGACDLDVPDLNNPGIDQLEENPTPSAVSAACTGLLIGNRRNTAQANGLVAQLGILGREAYNFDQADPRFVGELLEGPLAAGSPFGGNFWTLPYANIRLAEIILDAAPRVTEFSEAEQSAIAGFVHTIKALDLLEVANTRDENGGVIDTDRSLEDDLAPLVGKAEMFDEIARLLDEAADELGRGGDAFPFALSNGYEGFDTPETFRQFNRAIRARVAVYVEDYATALTALDESFIVEGAAVTLADMDLGVYHSYSTGTGDAVNNLINPNIYAHPGLVTDGTGDLRLERKVAMTDSPGTAGGLMSDQVFLIYPSPESPVPIIRNEELILLRAEALWFTGDETGAVEALNTVRTESGGLTVVNVPAGDDAAFIDALLYERRYSLMFEGGHRWIDLRRFGIELPLDLPDHTRNIRYPIPDAECNARPDEPRCDLGST